LAISELKSLLLAEPRLTLAVAESLTCGGVQARIGGISGASEFFLGGITAYTLDQKVRHLGISRASARRVNCVSADVAREMAQGVCRMFGSDLGLATTGYAEPAPAEGVPVPFAWWAVAHKRKRRLVAIVTGRVDCPGMPRLAVQKLVSAAAIAGLVSYLKTLRAHRRVIGAFR
jgi:nicotinamide-nucleotide amidase